MDARVKPGHDAEFSARASLHQFNFQTAWLSQRSAAPVGLVGAGYRRIPNRPLSKKNRGRAGRRWAQTDPQASVPRDAEAHQTAPLHAFALHKGSASPPVPRRPARGVYRFAPHGPRWTDLSGNLPYGSLPIHRLRAQTDADLPVTGCRLRPSPGPGGARLARRDTCGLDRRACTSHLRCTVIPRPPLPAPCLKMLIRHPSVTRRDGTHYRGTFPSGDRFFSALNLLGFFSRCQDIRWASG